MQRVILRADSAEAWNRHPCVLLHGGTPNRSQGRSEKIKSFMRFGHPENHLVVNLILHSCNYKQVAETKFVLTDHVIMSNTWANKKWKQYNNINSLFLPNHNKCTEYISDPPSSWEAPILLILHPVPGTRATGQWPRAWWNKASPHT